LSGQTVLRIKADPAKAHQVALLWGQRLGSAKGWSDRGPAPRRGHPSMRLGQGVAEAQAWEGTFPWRIIFRGCRDVAFSHMPHCSPQTKRPPVLAGGEPSSCPLGCRPADDRAEALRCPYRGKKKRPRCVVAGGKGQCGRLTIRHWLVSAITWVKYRR